jgi:hypothetical protein
METAVFVETLETLDTEGSKLHGGQCLAPEYSALE